MYNIAATCSMGTFGKPEQTKQLKAFALSTEQPMAAMGSLAAIGFGSKIRSGISHGTFPVSPRRGSASATVDRESRIADCQRLEGLPLMPSYSGIDSGTLSLTHRSAHDRLKRCKFRAMAHKIC